MAETQWWYDEDEEQVARDEYDIWHNDAYQQDHPEEYPELFEDGDDD